MKGTAEMESDGGWTPFSPPFMLFGKQGIGSQVEGGSMASTRGSSFEGENPESVSEGHEQNVAPIVIRLVEPGGHGAARHVRLRVDYFSGSLRQRAGRVLSSLVSAPEGSSLSEADRGLFETQLRAWLARNASALETGSALASSLSDDPATVTFEFVKSEVARPSMVVPARPMPTTASQPAPESTPEAAPAGAAATVAGRALRRRGKK